MPVLGTDDAAWREAVSAAPSEPPAAEPVDDSLFMLIFTSGTSGEPKAVRITHEKVTFPGAMLAGRFGLGADDVLYVSMPLFHSNAVMAGWGPALASGGGASHSPRSSRPPGCSTTYGATGRRTSTTSASRSPT